MQGKRRFTRGKASHGRNGPEEASLRTGKGPDDKPNKPEHVPVDDDDYEDGDIATPKRDRDDDEPL